MIMTIQKRNFILLWARSALTVAATTLTATGVLSGYLLWAGVGEQKIAFYQSLVPLVNTVVSLLLSGYAARVRNTVKAFGISCVSMGILTMLYALLFLLDGKAPAFYPLLMVLGALLSVASAIRNIFEYKMPCEVMDITEYSGYLSVNGIVGAVSGIGISAAASYCYKAFDFQTVSIAAFVLSGLLCLAAALVNRFIIMINPSENAESTDGKTNSSFAILRDRDFLILALPNTIRGIGEAVIAMITVLAVTDGIVQNTDGQTITTITQIATFISCILYGILTPRLRAARVCMLGAATLTVLIAAFLTGRYTFFLLFGIAYIGYYTVSAALPDMIYQAVDQNIMSAFHTWRLAFMTAGNTAATALIGTVVGKVPNIVIVTAGVVSFMIVSLAYYLLFGKRIMQGKPKRSAE